MSYHYSETKSKLVDVFVDTEIYCEENTKLKDYIKYSKDHTTIYKEDEYPDISNRTIITNPIIEVTKNRSFQQAIIEHNTYPDKKIGVLNFASATKSGGGVRTGSSAQEESLCRCSTLFYSLNQYKCYKEFYDVNKLLYHPIYHSDIIIYSPDIYIIKTDEERYPVRLEEKDWVKVDVLSCSAPNLKSQKRTIEVKVSDKELYDIHLKRGKHILHTAAYNNIDILVLGAFGSGVFENDPKVVANAYNKVLEEYSKYFYKIVFAIYCNSYDTYNYTSYNNIIEKKK